MQELTAEQARKFYLSEVWRDMSAEDCCRMQLFQSKVCMPMNHFHQAMCKHLRRVVLPWEFGNLEKLQREFLGQERAPTIREILSAIPEHVHIEVIDLSNI